MKGKDIIIYNGAVAKDIIDNKLGELTTININKKHTERTVFFFKNTKELKEALKERHDISISY